MATQFLRDSSGNLLGKIEDFGGKYWIYDSHGTSLGKFDPKINVTFDKSGNRIGTGNLLTTLIR